MVELHLARRPGAGLPLRAWLASVGRGLQRAQAREVAHPGGEEPR